MYMWHVAVDRRLATLTFCPIINVLDKILGLIKSTPELNQILDSVRNDPGTWAGGGTEIGGPVGGDTMDTR